MARMSRQTFAEESKRRGILSPKSTKSYQAGKDDRRKNQQKLSRHRKRCRGKSPDIYPAPKTSSARNRRPIRKGRWTCSTESRATFPRARLHEARQNCRGIPTGTKSKREQNGGLSIIGWTSLLFDSRAKIRKQKNSFSRKQRQEDERDALHDRQRFRHPARFDRRAIRGEYSTESKKERCRHLARNSTESKRPPDDIRQEFRKNANWNAADILHDSRKNPKGRRGTSGTIFDETPKGRPTESRAKSPALDILPRGIRADFMQV